MATFSSGVTLWRRSFFTGLWRCGIAGCLETASALERGALVKISVDCLSHNARDGVSVSQPFYLNLFLVVLRSSSFLETSVCIYFTLIRLFEILVRAAVAQRGFALRS